MFYGVSEEIRNETVVKKSRFIATLAPIKSARDAEDKIAEIRAEFKDATHNCYAYIADNMRSEMRCSDDGEPQGTAGAPMLEILKKRGMGYTLAVVTRYFGGVKLGANGLIGAYGDSVIDALDKAQIKKFKMSVTAEAAIDYSLDKAVSAELARNCRIIRKSYSDGVKINFAAPEDDFENIVSALKNIALGRIQITLTGSGYEPYDTAAAENEK